ncbi:SGNH/GDSL hydrolase family protein [Methylocella sp.]|uniref:SGNH/GDSL hydrolase family protein n=1 Tax=Methylocella sp. TaxID=1978226 RepID=UPI0037832700
MARQTAVLACALALGLTAPAPTRAAAAQAQQPELAAPQTPLAPQTGLAPPQPAPPALSPACEVPSADLAAPTALPNFAAALQKRQRVTILAIGSSSTSGTGASSAARSYPSQLEPILETALKGEDVVIVNRGLPGEVADSAADRIRSEVALARPDLVLWQLGTNDALARVSARDFEATVRETVRWLKDAGIDVVLIGLQYSPRLARDPAYGEIREALRRIALEENVLYVSRYDAMRFIAQRREGQPMMATDGFHLNDLGYHCMAEHVAHALIVSLFRKKTRPAEN